MNGKSKKPEAATKAPAPPALPLFYSKPAPVTASSFGGKSLASPAKLTFSCATNSIPLNIAEFALAQRFYPIVFSAAGETYPLAIVGLKDKENLFVDENGRWERDAYVPAYVRRYPFILMGGPGEKQFTLCAETDTDLVVKGDKNPFFRDGKASALIDRALKFCSAFQSNYEKTREFCAALAAHDLLLARNAQVKLSSGKKAVLGPFRVIDRAKFAKLPDTTVAEWHRRGWLGAIHAQLFSESNWPGLARKMKAA